MAAMMAVMALVIISEAIVTSAEHHDADEADGELEVAPVEGKKRKKARRGCETDGCTTPAQSGFKHCVKHGGCKRCETDGCPAPARGGFKHCQKHGGGKRCETDGCPKPAHNGFKHCKKHGGGKRCETDGCPTPAQGGFKHCSKHGGGKRCETDGCPTPAQRGFKHCKKHGGCKRCETDGCITPARHGFKHCHTHGGGKRCEHGRLQNSCCEDQCGMIPSISKCIGCFSKQVKGTRGDPLSQLCLGCRTRSGVARIKKYEEETKKWLTEAGLHWSYSNTKLPCATTTRFPDFVFATGKEWVVILEIDENQHRFYNEKCEIARLSELMDSKSEASLHVVRFNPNNPKSTKEDLLAALRDAIATNYGVLHDTGCAVQYLGYSVDRIASLDQLTCELQKK